MKIGQSFSISSLQNQEVGGQRAGDPSLIAEMKKTPELSKPRMKIKEPSVQEITSTSNILKVPKPEPVSEPREHSSGGEGGLNTER